MPETEEVLTTEDETRDGGDASSLKSLLGASSPAQVFALIVGALLLLFGLAVLVTNFNFSTGNEIATKRLLLLDVNGWSGLLDILAGLLLILGARSAASAKRATLVVGLVYLLVTIWSLFTSTVAGIIPVGDLAATIYGAIAILSLTAALAPEANRSGPASASDEDA